MGRAPLRGKTPKLPKGRVFNLHFNRIAMQRGDPKVWSVQTSKGCFHAEIVIALTPLQTTYKPDKKNNPRAFLRGIGCGDWITLKDGKEALVLSPLGWDFLSYAERKALSESTS